MNDAIISNPTHLGEHITLERAKLRVQVARPRDWKKLDSAMEDLFHADGVFREALLRRGMKETSDGIWVPDLRSYISEEAEEVLNQITNSGRDQLHLQGYGITSLATNGTNYIALTNTAITPGPGDTTLSGEIVANGLSRTQGAYAHTTGTNTTTISNTFTATATQACQAAALFNLSSAGVMNHELTFSQRTLNNGDTLAVTYTITLG